MLSVFYLTKHMAGEISNTPQPAMQESRAHAVLQNLKERAFGKTPSQEAVETARPITKARIEGEELVKSVTGKLSEDQRLAVEADIHGKTYEAKKETGSAVVSEAQVLLRWFDGKKLSDREQQVLQKIETNPTTVDPRQIYLEAKASQQAAVKAKTDQETARGALPKTSYEREQGVVNRMEMSQERQMAAGIEVRRVLAEALANQSGLSTTALTEATTFARTFARADSDARKQMTRLVDELSARFPNQTTELRNKLGEYQMRTANEKAVSVAEKPQLQTEQIAQRTTDLVDKFGLVRDGSKAEVLKRLGVTFVENQDGKKIPQVKQGSLAERYLGSQDYASTLSEALKKTVESLSDQPLKAVGALELAQYAFQEGQMARKLNAQVEQIRVAATATEQTQISEEIARTGKDKTKAEASLERRKAAETLYTNVTNRVETTAEDIKKAGREVSRVSKLVRNRIIEVARKVKEHTVDVGKQFVRNLAVTSGQKIEEIDQHIEASFKAGEQQKADQIATLEEQLKTLQAELDRARGGGTA